MCEFAGVILDQQNFSAKAVNAHWAETVSDSGLLLAADALANAQRRIVEGRFTDSVLRSYRAAECATQMRLLAIGIHPAKVDACPSAYERYRTTDPPDIGALAFNSGLRFLSRGSKVNTD